MFHLKAVFVQSTQNAFINPLLTTSEVVSAIDFCGYPLMRHYWRCRTQICCQCYYWNIWYRCRFIQKKFLINTALLDSANHYSIARFFDDSIKLLGEDFNKDMILFISVAAPYMTKAAQAIKIFYPKMTHIICLVYVIHCVCEKIRSMYSNVDRLIYNIKKVVLKAPSRVQIFKSVEYGLELPPQPIITRWGNLDSCC